MNKQKGFTLIELLVVIAIIGILASVVLASLSSARLKAQDVVVKSQLSNMRSQAELFFSTNGNSYGTFGTAGACDVAGGGGSLFTGVGAVNSLTVLMGSVLTTKDCGSDATSWSVAAAAISPGVFYCVDNLGASREANSAGTPYDSVTGGTTPAHATVGATVCS